ncbi:MAG: family 10 glycosylhydrolase [Candidatus Cloacimonadaceae bacterium]|nr:family 10 glycosylhydrolase [Candidatus Cloacimonadaceae bacterium]
MWILPWSMTSAAQVDGYIAQALRSNQTDLLVEVRYRADALYRPNRVPNQYFNPEPRSYILPNNSFDPLDYTLKAAHRHNLRVHAWVVVFNATPLVADLIAKNYIYRYHNDWITHDRMGKKMNSNAQFGNFIDPGIPEVHDYLLNVFSDLILGYPDLDGLHLDYIRYPNNDLGFHPISENRYKEYNKTNIPITWNQWRIRQVSEFVEKTYIRAKELNPDLIVSAAVFANYSDAVNLYAQEWKDWLDRGIVDQIYPMAYHLDIRQFESQLKLMESMGYKDRIVVGVRAWDTNGGSLLPKEGDPAGSYSIFDVANRIAIIRRMRFSGIALFSYDGLVKGDAFNQLSGLTFGEKTIAALSLLQEDTLLKQDMGQGYLRYAADLAINRSHNQYQINLHIPIEGNWFWEVRSSLEGVVYTRNRYYLKGRNLDYWNGITESGDRLPEGNYLICIYREQDLFEYIIPVHFDGLRNVYE